MKTREEIAILVEKFLDGRTSNQEEQMLYDWFSANDVSEEWQPLKEMFAWYADGMPEKREEECTYKPEDSVTVHVFYSCVPSHIQSFIFHLSTQNMISRH